MPTIRVPVTTYRVSSSKPNQKWGSPAALPLASAAHRVYVKVPVDKVPADAVIDLALVKSFADRAVAAGKNLRVVAPNQAWTSSITWGKQPTVGSVIDTETTVATAAGQPLPDLDITTWFATRSRNGLRLESTSAAPAWWMRGSSGSDSQPYIEVTYHVAPDTPGALRPDGPNPVENAVPLGESAAVSVAQPVLTYAGDEDMTAQRVQYSVNASTVLRDSGWLPATEGYYDPLLDPNTGTGHTGAIPVLSDGATGIYWRVMTDGPDGQSDWSGWAYYRFASLPDVTILNPPAVTDDGSPTLEWAVEAGFTQTGWKTDLSSAGKSLDSHVWANNADTDWTPNKGVAVPGGAGRFTLTVRDQLSPFRVAAHNAPIEKVVTFDFTTSLGAPGSSAGSSTLVWEDPVPVIEGTRTLGAPDQVGLFRDGVMVPLWDEDGNVYTSWAPAAPFFTGSNFRLPDYTATPRTEPTWQVYVRIAGVKTTVGDPITQKIFTPSVWLLDPRSGERIEIQSAPGDNGPIVEQETVENSILHLPLNGGLIVEPKRRRLVRSTRFGTLGGTIVNEAEDTFNEWVEGDSSLRYRLIFGKVNWPVIVGDYSPQDMFYADECGPDRVLVSANWWQRKTDV